MLGKPDKLFNATVLEERVESIISTLDENTCSNLNYCKPPLAWMKKSKEDELKEKQAWHFDRIQSEKLKQIPRESKLLSLII